MTGFTFDADDGHDVKHTGVARRYVEHFGDFRRDGKGLLLFGTVGTGERYFAACIANALIDKGYRVLFTNFPRVVSGIQGAGYGNGQEYIDSLQRYDLLILDDLGAERGSDFMLEQIFNVIDSRYTSGKPMILTSNLSAQELKSPPDTRHARIYDRIMERCFPVEISGRSRRRETLRSSAADMKKLLGI